MAAHARDIFRLAVITTVGVVLAIAMATTATTATAATTAQRVAPAAGVARPAPVFVAFRSGFRLGSGSRLGFGSRSRYRYGYGYSRRSPSLLHRVVKTAIWLYVLHLFFTHGGLSILLWIIIIGFVLSRVRRRRRSARRAQTFRW